MHHTVRLCMQRVRVVYGDWQMFLPRENCTSCDVPKANCLPQGLEPLPSPLPNLLPKLPNLVPKPRVQPNLLPRWQPSLQPSLQLESPFLWPLLSMCSSSESNTPARRSGTQSLSLKLNMYPNRQFLAHFVAGMPLCLHVLFCVADPLHSNRRGGGDEGTVSWGMFPRGCEDTVAGYYARGRGGTPNLLCSTTKETSSHHPLKRTPSRFSSSEQLNPLGRTFGVGLSLLPVDKVAGGFAQLVG